MSINIFHVYVEDEYIMPVFSICICATTSAQAMYIQYIIIIVHIIYTACMHL